MSIQKSKEKEHDKTKRDSVAFFELSSFDFGVESRSGVRVFGITLTRDAAQTFSIPRGYIRDLLFEPF